jgi:hypothetical protein
METEISSPRRNPSRETCERTIQRILAAEISERGKNEHFRSASDFMSFFESLYPASDALTKQVQRAVKSLNMPKDADGYLIPDKTSEEVREENAFRALFADAGAQSVRLSGTMPIFLAVKPILISYLMSLISESPLFSGKYVTMLPCSNGILFFTEQPGALLALFENLTKPD